MNTFYASDLTKNTARLTLSEEEAKHALQVKRLKTGSSVVLVNGSGIKAVATIVEINRRQCICEVESIEEIDPPKAQTLTVAISTIRPNRMDYVAEKLCELGVGHIQFLYTEHTSIRTFKQKHLTKIAISAMKQSRQAWLSTLSAPIALNDWLKHSNTADLRVIAHFHQQATVLSELPSAVRSKVLLIGPEGGFSDAEVGMCLSAGFKPLLLGDTILRAETAAVVGAGLLLSLD
ncbi:MAG: RsmE family RNA methyltransferase [Calditrichia bacterium]